MLLICTGCTHLLPSTKVTLVSPWEGYEDANREYMKIVPEKTTLDELKALGFDPTIVPNIRIMSATEVVGVFVPNSSIEINTLAPGIQKCIRSKERCTAYKIEPSFKQSKRTGNFFLDMLTFKRVTETEGWEFLGLIAIIDEVVTYRDPPGGRPLIKSEEVVSKPLGPLQEIGSVVESSVQGIFK
ncbi:MAG: hypothetical protein HGA96_08240 [Desulfobulbaceae bacterium]|nr:hypothetical protein [Desulfobulbaceae bacterium]